MRNFLVPQTAHCPVTAGRPFFRTTSCTFSLAVFSRHLKQYISASDSDQRQLVLPVTDIATISFR